MTENDLNVAKDIGSLQADMRTVKHDMANVSAKLDGLSTQISNLHVKQEKGLGFVAGVVAVLGGVGALLMMIAKALFGSLGGHA